jgi:hypothetical protein
MAVQPQPDRITRRSAAADAAALDLEGQEGSSAVGWQSPPAPETDGHGQTPPRRSASAEAAAIKLEEDEPR